MSKTQSPPSKKPAPAPGDGGSIMIGVSNDPVPFVVMNFDRPVPGLNFTPEQAESIGVSLIQNAAHARATKGALAAPVKH